MTADHKPAVITQRDRLQPGDCGKLGLLTDTGTVVDCSLTRGHPGDHYDGPGGIGWWQFAEATDD